MLNFSIVRNLELTRNMVGSEIGSETTFLTKSFRSVRGVTEERIGSSDKDARTSHPSADEEEDPAPTSPNDHSLCNPTFVQTPYIESCSRPKLSRALHSVLLDGKFPMAGALRFSLFCVLRGQ